MSDTAYTDLVGPAVNAAWLNDVNNTTYKGPSGYVYVGNGAGSLGTWTAISSITVGNATNATNATNAVNLTGTVASGVTGTTQTPSDSSTKMATTNYVDRKQLATPSLTTPSLSAGAMTLALNACTIPFRSATLTNGGVSEILCSGLSLTIPSGGTLGSINATTTRYAVGVAYNGGTPVLMVGNVQGLNTDTSTLISPTTISAGSTSAGVWYSASSVSANSPFTIVGFIDSTQATAGTYATAPNVIPGDVAHLGSLQSIGWGQSIQDVTGSRTNATTYYNTTGRAITVIVAGQNGASSSVLAASINGSTPRNFARCDLPSGVAVACGTFIVPAGASYQVTGATASINFWTEIR